MFAQALHPAPLRPSDTASRDAAVDAAMMAMRQKLYAKFSNGPRTEESVAAELKDFDAILAAHQGERSDSVARANFMRAMLYLDVFRDYDKATTYFEEIRLNFLGLPASSAANEMLAKIREARSSSSATTKPAETEKAAKHD